MLGRKFKQVYHYKLVYYKNVVQKYEEQTSEHRLTSRNVTHTQWHFYKLFCHYAALRSLPGKFILCIIMYRPSRQQFEFIVPHAQMYFLIYDEVWTCVVLWREPRMFPKMMRISQRTILNINMSHDVLVDWSSFHSAIFTIHEILLKHHTTKTKIENWE
jgi:hypothetical protein